MRHERTGRVAARKSWVSDCLSLSSREGRLSQETHLILISGGNRPRSPLSGACVIFNGPASVSLLLREIFARLKAIGHGLPLPGSRVGAALDYLGDHYAVASVRRLGHAVRASPRYLSAVFRSEIGISPRTYINQLRVDAAKWLLLETGEKLETVAAQVGFHDASHLSRLFLRLAGDRPGTYRRQRGDT